jgi:hypothetical protein
MQKTGYRFRQAERAVEEMVGALGRGAASVGLDRMSQSLLAWLDAMTTRIGKVSRAAAAGTVEGLSKVPLIGAVVMSYAAHYDRAEQQHAVRLSEKVSNFFGRWSEKFTAEYYEAKEREEAAKGVASA